MGDILEFPDFTKYGPARHNERVRLAKMFRGFSADVMRNIWDGIEDDSFYRGSFGVFDCEDIHAYMNMIGDGGYCAV